MTFTDALELVVQGFEVLGVGILVVGGALSVVAYAADLRRLNRRSAYERLRANLGRTILLGLEVLIVADIVLTVAGDDNNPLTRRDAPEFRAYCKSIWKDLDIEHSNA